MGAERTGDQDFMPKLPFESKIAALRAKIEERRTERILLGLDKAIIIVKDTEEYGRRLNLPTLSGADRIPDVKFDETGNLYTTWYQPKKTEVRDGRRQLINPTGQLYIVLPLRKKRREDYLENLPQERPIAELILGETFFLEEAIRQQQHILDGYQPGTAALEIEFARQIIAYTEAVAFRFLSQRRVTREDLEGLAHETGRFLENSNLYDPRDSKKRKILDKLLLVGQPDAAGRPNYLGVLGRAFAAHTAAVERLTIGGLTADKFIRNLEVLSYTRENYRWRFNLAARELEMVLEHPAFRVRWADRKEREALAGALKFVVDNHLANPKVNPYLRSARWAAINIMGCREERKDVNRRIMGESIAKEVFSKVPVTRLVTQGNFTEARRRIELSIAQLRKTFRDYEDIEKA